MINHSAILQQMIRIGCISLNRPWVKAYRMVDLYVDLEVFGRTSFDQEHPFGPRDVLGRDVLVVPYMILRPWLQTVSATVMSSFSSCFGMRLNTGSIYILMTVKHMICIFTTGSLPDFSFICCQC